MDFINIAARRGMHNPDAIEFRPYTLEKSYQEQQ